MTRRIILVCFRCATVVLLSGGLLAQERAVHQDAFRAWRQADASLEKDAASAGAALAARVQKIAPTATKYAAARAHYFETAKADAQRKAAPGVAVTILSGTADVAKTVDAVIANRKKVVDDSLKAIGDDPDPGLRQLKQAMDRERSALEALSEAVKTREMKVNAAAMAASAASQNRDKVNEESRNLAVSFDQAAQAASRQQKAWVEYYRLLTEASGKVEITEAPTTPEVVASAPVPRPAKISPQEPATVASARITPVPLGRYVGSWIYSPATAVFHGPEPESVDLSVREENGEMNGNLSVRFKAAPGIPSERITVSFDFTGALQSTRIQTFPLVTADGTKGRIDLIPGPAFNILEIAFETDAKPGKVRSGNFLLIKK